MRCLADLHHGDLYRSLLLLFEKRLGHEVYRPIGMDWFDEGYWRYLFPARATASQYLSEGPYPHLKGAELARVKAGEFDLLISSTPPMFYAFERLIREHALKAKHVFQSGNDWLCMPEVRNFLNSTTVQAPPHVHEVKYHQEFSLTDYCPPATPPGRVISSFMHYMPEPEKFYALEAAMPGWTFRAFGAGNRDGQPADLVQAMRETRYLYHQKEVEAYGYNTWYAAACGIPIIMKVARNRHQSIGAVLNEETSIDLERPQVLPAVLRRFDADHEFHRARMYAAFCNAVDFDAEEARIRKWMEGLK